MMNKTANNLRNEITDGETLNSRHERAYERAVEFIEQEWVEAGHTREALNRGKELASIYDRLLGTNYSKENLYAAWDAEYPDTSYLYLRLLSIAERVLAPSEPTFLLLLRGLANYYVA